MLIRLDYNTSIALLNRRIKPGTVTSIACILGGSYPMLLRCLPSPGPNARTGGWGRACSTFQQLGGLRRKLRHHLLHMIFKGEFYSLQAGFFDEFGFI